MKKFDIESLKTSLEACKPIIFSILFGSSMLGEISGDSSDIDIALYLSEKPNTEMLAEIIGICEDSTGHDLIDITILNNASPILSFEAIKGRLLSCKVREAYESFFSLTCRLYEDEMIRIERYRLAIL